MLDFPIALALFNFLPVILTAFGMWLVVGCLRRVSADAYPMIALGAVLVIAGGLSKAVWKLVAASTGADVAWLAAALFPLIGPGFLLAGIAAWAGARRIAERKSRRYWRAALTVLAFVLTVVIARQWLLQLPRGWFLPLLVSASLGNLLFITQLARIALALRRSGAAWLLAINLGVVFVLPAIALRGADSLAMHWLEQGLTAASAGAFALAAWLIVQATGRAPAGAARG